jgi:hypothetical protein
VQAGAPALASAEAAEEATRNLSYGEQLDQEYDPIWLGGLNLHDELAKRKLIRTDVADARIGDFIDVGGALGVMDFATFQTLWDKPSVHRTIQGGIDNVTATAEPANRRERRKQESLRDRLTGKSATGELVGEIISAIPHRIQARLVTQQQQWLWATLRGESLILDAGDLYLKHGVALDGRWRIFGVLDALPRDSAIDFMKDQIIAQFSETPFGRMAVSMVPMLEAGFSRPAIAWGVTPIMIYRELAES